MQQLTFHSPGKFEWRDVPAPKLATDTDAIVAPVAVARCDLDLYIANGFAPQCIPGQPSWIRPVVAPRNALLRDLTSTPPVGIWTSSRYWKRRWICSY
jgi:hypothetical protein